MNGQNMGGMGGGKASPVMVQKSLGGMSYPASKQDLVNHAKMKGADDMVMNTLQRLPEQQYETPADVAKAIGMLE